MDLTTVTDIVPAALPGTSSLGSWQHGDAWLAGGTWLFSEPQPQLRRLRDLTSLHWPALAITEAGLDIAATCTLAELAAFTAPPGWPATRLFQQCCAALLGSFKVWNAATVGGNICLSLPAGPMTSLTAALDGVCTVLSAEGGEHRVPVVDFVTGAGTNVLRPGDLLRSVQLPATALTGRTAFRQFSLTPVGRSAAVVIGRLDEATGAVTVTVTASTTRPVQFRFPRLPSASELANAVADAELPYHDDVHGDLRWRAQLTRLLTEQVRAELEAGTT
jgi:CO/xanthine dehydrogenase FAD-binding subunit